MTVGLTACGSGAGIDDDMGAGGDSEPVIGAATAPDMPNVQPSTNLASQSGTNISSALATGISINGASQTSEESLVSTSQQPDSASNFSATTSPVQNAAENPTQHTTQNINQSLENSQLAAPVTETQTGSETSRPFVVPDAQPNTTDSSAGQTHTSVSSVDNTESDTESYSANQPLTAVASSSPSKLDALTDSTVTNTEGSQVTPNQNSLASQSTTPQPTSTVVESSASTTEAITENGEQTETEPSSENETLPLVSILSLIEQKPQEEEVDPLSTAPAQGPAPMSESVDLSSSVSYDYPPSVQELSSGHKAKSLPQPGYRKTVAAQVDGMKLTRVTQNSVFGVSNGNARHSYSKRQVFNADETLMDMAGKLIDTRTYAITEGYIPMGNERAWSETDPDTLIGVRFAPEPNLLASYNVKKDQLTELRQFSDYRQCRMGHGEGNPSQRGDRVLLVCSDGDGGTETAVSYDIDKDKVLGTLKLHKNYNWGSFSRSGDYIIIENSHWSSPTRELLRYNPDLSGRKLLTTYVEHGDLGFDENGDDVYVMIAWDYIYYIRIKDGRQVNLGISDNKNTIGFGHISCRATQRPGWCYFSANDEHRLGAVRIAQDGNTPYTDTRDRTVYPGASQVEIWGYHRTSAATYDAQAKASVSPSGRRLVYTSDWYGNGEINSYSLDYRP